MVHLKLGFLKCQVSFFIFYRLITINLIFTGYGIFAERVINCWLCLEISIVVFLGILASRKSITRKAIVVYFRIQVIPSIIFLALQLVAQSSQRNFFWVITLIIFLKLGSAPFHSWYMSMALQLPIISLIWLLTIQKLIPFQIISLTFCEKTFSWLIIGSTIIRVGYMVIQSKFTKFLIASSVFSNNWVLRGILGGRGFLWQKYFIVYRILVTLLVLSWGGQGLETVVFFISRTLRFNWRLITIFILGGFPPGPIFLNKVLIIQSLVGQSYILLSLILVVGSSVRLLAVCNIVTLGQIRATQYFFKTPVKLSSWRNFFIVGFIRSLIVFRSPFEL